MRWALCTLLSLFVVGCDGCDDASPSEATDPVAEPEAVDSVPEDVDPPAPSHPLEESRARAVLDAWLAAQNEGDFEAYQALYAQRFEGVKRSGERTYRYDRAQWLEDREGMFARPMEVAVEDVRISSASEAAVVTFEQRWASETYSDVGPKRIVLIETEGELRISREEMLASRIVGETEVAPPEPASFLLVVDVGGPHLLLSQNVDEAMGRGPLSLASRSAPAAATRSVDPARLPEPLRTLIGARIEVFGARGQVCTANVGAPVIAHRVVPHFATVQHWDGELGGEAIDDASVAADVWELGASGAIVTAPLEGEECERALWARTVGDHHPKLFTPSLAEGREQIRALSAFRGQPAHEEIQRDFRGYGAGHSGPWDSHGSARPMVIRWIEAGTGQELVSVTARAGSGCADFHGRMWSLFEASEDGLEPRTDPDGPGAFEPRTIIDVDEDGSAEVVIEDGLLRAGPDGKYVRVIDVTPPNLDCDC